MSDEPPRRGAPIRGISAVLPVYNEAPHIVEVVEATLDALHDAAPDVEIIVVNDGSTDATPRLCADLASRYPAVHVVRHARNAGYGAAVRSGIEAATKQYLFLMDANRRFDPAEIARLVQWGDRYDVVAGYRAPRHGSPYQALLSFLFRTLIRLVFGIRARDGNCGFKLFRLALLKSMDLRSSSVAINAEILYRAGQQRAALREVGVHHYPRRTRRRGAAFRLRALLRATREMIALRRRIGEERRAARTVEKDAASGS